MTEILGYTDAFISSVLKARDQMLEPWQDWLITYLRFFDCMTERLAGSGITLKPIHEYLIRYAHTADLDGSGAAYAVETTIPSIRASWRQQLGIRRNCSMRFHFEWDDMIYQAKFVKAKLEEALEEIDDTMVIAVEALDNPKKFILFIPEHVQVCVDYLGHGVEIWFIAPYKLMLKEKYDDES